MNWQVLVSDVNSEDLLGLLGTLVWDTAADLLRQVWCHWYDDEICS